MKESNRQIGLGAVLSYLGVAVGIVAGLLYNPWMINMIGKSDYALYTLAMSLINTFLVDFGLSMATQRYAAKFIAEKNQTAVNNIVGLIFKLYLIITAILTVLFTILFFFLENIYTGLQPAEFQKFSVLYIMVAIYSITSFPFITLKGVLSAYEKFIPLKVCDLLYKILTVGLTIIALLMGYGVYILVVVNLISSIIVIAIRIIIIKRTIPLKMNLKYHNKQEVKELFGFSIWTSVSTIVMRLLISLAPSILGVVSDSSSIAVFGYAVSIESYIYSFVNAINGFFLPKLSRFSVYEDEVARKKVMDLMVSVGRYILYLYALMYVGFLMLGDKFVILTVGSGYYESFICTLLICAYGIVAYPQQIGNTYTVVKNKVKKRGIISLVCMALYGIIAFPLSKYFGCIGISVAICVALVAQTILMNIMFKKDLKLDIGKFFKECYLKSLPGMLVFIALSFVATRSIPLTGWFGFGVKTASIIVIFAVVLLMMLLSRNERKSIKKRIVKR